MESGYGLQDLLSSRKSVLNGITNGIDVDEWDPSSNKHIAAHLSANDLSEKIELQSSSYLNNIHVKNLPKGAIVINYAYMIHIEIGNKMVAAMVIILWRSLGFGSNNMAKTLWNCMVFSLLWHIWLERNNRIFEDKEMLLEDIFEKAKFSALQWAFADKAFKGYSFSVVAFNWKDIIGFT